MMQTLEQVLARALDNLSRQITTFLPPLLAGLTILLGAFVLASLTRWLLAKTFRGVALDRFLRESGLSSVLFHNRGMKVSRMVPNLAYWSILLAGALTGLSAFDSKITSRIVESTVFVFPKLVTAAAILLGGTWLAQYLGRTVLLWTVNDEIPHPRRWALATRAAVVVTSVVVAADVLDFARNVFLAAFIILAGGVVLGLSLAFGLGGRAAVERFVLRTHERRADQQSEAALWRHL
jgi:hypothetical protein